MIHAITREVSPAIGQCELTHIDPVAIDVELARSQHAEYRQLLTELGCEVIHLPAEPDLPDSVFVEDTAVVLDELAVLTRPGAESDRRRSQRAICSQCASRGRVCRLLGRLPADR